MSLKRIAQEQANLQREPVDTFSAGPEDAKDLRRWVGHIVGPSDTPYEQEVFFFTIVFPEDYPAKPFHLNFMTPITHPAISEDGKVWIPELEGKHWSPVQTVRSILLCLEVALANADQFIGILEGEDANTESASNP